MTALEVGAKRLVRRMAPQWYWARHLQAIRPHPELALLPLLADRARTSLDIGASGCLYLSRLADSSRRCVVFEPRPPAASDLRAMTRGLSLATVQVEPVALSERSGTATVRVLARDRHPVGSYDVPTRRLDDYFLDDVGFVKLDVQGHEAAVLRGGWNTIGAQRPRLLLSMEERHRPGGMAEVFELLGGLGYHGFFALEGALAPVDKFDPDVHQAEEPTGPWADTFLFLPDAPSATELQAIEEPISGGEFPRSETPGPEGTPSRARSS